MSCEKVEINMHQKYVDIFYNTKKDWVENQVWK